jgi:hypothetical protein
MSIEIVLYPPHATRDDLVAFLKSQGYLPCGHLWDWPKGTVNLHWFEPADFTSFDGVEASVFPLSGEERIKHSPCTWALHTRTRAGASEHDRAQQNQIIRAARKEFGGSFFNNWHGKNRYTPPDATTRTPIGRGLYLLHMAVVEQLKKVKLALPHPILLAAINGKPAPSEVPESIARVDPARTVYNALVPFAVAALEHFFSNAFKILLRYDKQARIKLTEQNKKVEFADALALVERAKSIEDIVAEWYSFQRIDSIHRAFNEWFGIDIWKILRQRRRVGKRIGWLEKRFENLIDFRHGIVHRFEVNVEFERSDIEELLDLSILLIDTFIEHIETSRGEKVRD